MEENWEKFETETKKQLSTFIKKSSKTTQVAHRTISYVLENMSFRDFNIMDTLNIIRQNTNKRETAIAGMMAFLWEFEGSYKIWVDAYCYLLVKNHHDLFFNRNYVKSLEDIRDVSISAKLIFLENHDFKIFKRTNDRKLRNNIAHHNFAVRDSGIVIIDKQEVDVGSRFRDLIRFKNTVFETFNRCLGSC